MADFVITVNRHGALWKCHVTIIIAKIITVHNIISNSNYEIMKTLKNGNKTYFIWHFVKNKYYHYYFFINHRTALFQARQFYLVIHVSVFMIIPIMEIDHHQLAHRILQLKLKSSSPYPQTVCKEYNIVLWWNFWLTTLSSTFFYIPAGNDSLHIKSVKLNFININIFCFFETEVKLWKSKSKHRDWNLERGAPPMRLADAFQGKFPELQTLFFFPRVTDVRRRMDGFHYFPALQSAPLLCPPPILSSLFFSFLSGRNPGVH